jgi:hypothetical protein
MNEVKSFKEDRDSIRAPKNVASYFYTQNLYRACHKYQEIMPSASL